MCQSCKEHTEQAIVQERDAWWEEIRRYADENIGDYVNEYGRYSDYEQVMMEDYEKQNPRPKRFSEAKLLNEVNIVFIPKKR